MTEDETYKLVVGKSCDFPPVQNYLSFAIWSLSLPLLATDAASATDRWGSLHPGGLNLPRSNPDSILKATFYEVSKCLHAGKGLEAVLSLSMPTAHLEVHAFLGDPRFLLPVTEQKASCPCQAMARAGPAE